MPNDANSTLGVIAGILVWIALSLHSAGSKVVKVYLQQCDSARNCHTEPIEHYTAIPDAQAVIYTGPDGVVSSLHGCSVRDEENWSCEDGLGAFERMVEGTFSTTNAFSTAETIGYFHWWGLRALEAIRAR